MLLDAAALGRVPPFSNNASYGTPCACLDEVEKTAYGIEI